MKKEKQLKKVITFDLLDAEILEKYLKEMAIKGWIIDDIGSLCLYFKKIEPRDMEFFVDITTKDILNEYKMPEEEYLYECKENNLEHIYGNKKFQIFINEGNKYPLKRKKTSFFKAFYRPVILLVLTIICMLDFFYKYTTYTFFSIFISNNLLILCSILLVIIFSLFIIINLINITKDFRKNSTSNNSFNEEIFKIKNKIIKANCFCIGLFLGMTIYYSFFSTYTISNLNNKSELPIVLEDFGVKISSIRECNKDYSSSFLASYNRCIDSTYEEVYETKYNKKIKEEYEEIIMKDYYEIQYSVFKTKHINIMKRVLEDELNYNGPYEKVENEDVIKNWSAKEVYYNEKDDCDKVIVYDNYILEIYTNMNLNKEKIDLIKNKLM